MTRRDQLVEHMTRSIRENGVGATTVENVLRSSEVTAGSMYHYFPEGKEALVAAAVANAGADSASALADVMEATSSAVEGTELFYTELAREMEQTDYALGCPVGVPSTEAAGVDAVRNAGAEAFRSWIAVIAAALEDQGFSHQQAQTKAVFAVAAYEGASTLARTLRDTSVIYDTMEVVKQVVAGPD